MVCKCNGLWRARLANGKTTTYNHKTEINAMVNYFKFISEAGNKLS